MDLIEKMKDIENFGIDLKLKREEDEITYCNILRQWFEQNDNYSAYVIDEREFGLEYISDTGEESALSIYLKDSAIRFIPVSGDPFYAVMDVLQFIAELHKEVIGVLESKAEKFEEEVIEEESEEEASSEDWEWI